MKSYFQYNWLSFLMAGLPFGLVFLNWSDLPENIPFFWEEKSTNNINFGKFGIFFFPLVNLLVVLGSSFIPAKIKREKDTDLLASFSFMRGSTVLLLFYVFLLKLFDAVDYKSELDYALIYGILLFIIVVGRLLIFLEPSRYGGFRTPWSMNDDKNWEFTHLWSGRVWIFSGAVMMLLFSLISADLALLFLLIVVILDILAPFFFSYGFYKYFKVKK